MNFLFFIFYLHFIIKTTDHRPTDHRPTDQPTTFYLPTDRSPSTYIKIEDHILNMFYNL